MAKVKQLGIDGTLVNISRISQIDVTLNDVTAKLQDLRRHLSLVEDRVHTANSMNIVNRQLIIRIQVLHCISYIAVICKYRLCDNIFKLPPPVGAGGGYMFSGRPSVPLSVHACVRPCVRPSVIHVVVLCFRDISSIC